MRILGTFILSFFVAVAVNAESEVLKVMPTGDSIASGFHGTTEERGSYRKELEIKFLDFQYAYDFVGDFYYGSLVDRDYQGVGGHKIEEMTADYAHTIVTYNPDIVLLLAGTNNHGDAPVLNDFVSKYNDLLDIFGDTQVIMSTVPKFGYGRDLPYWTNEWVDNRNNVVFPNMNDAIGIVASERSNVSYVDLYSVLDPNTDLISDAVHPNKFGHKKLADLFWAEMFRVPGDTDGDGDVDGVDVATTFSSFTGPGYFNKMPSDGDVDADGDVDGVDLAAVFSNFTGPLTPAIPEPNTLCLIGGFSLCALRRRRVS